MAVDKERIEELEKLDKRLEIQRRLAVVFFLVLSIALVIYAIRIENKITRLNESSGVVIYKESSEEQTITTDGVRNEPESVTVIQITENVDEAKVSSPDDENTPEVTGKKPQNDTENRVDNGNVYYVTASGKKYHKAGCSYLSNTKREITTDEIISGGYTACSRCFKE